MITGRKRKGRRQVHRYTSSEIRRMHQMEDQWFESLFYDERFKNAISDLRDRLGKVNELPELLRQPGHNCTIHRHDKKYAGWDKPIDNLCIEFGIDEGFDLAYGPRYRIERHVFFDDPIGNLFHPLIKCETDPSPVPHISKICILPPPKLLSRDELNWLFADLELLIVDRQPAYPISPSASDELFTDLKGKDINCYKQRLQEAISKRIITDPSEDAHTLVALIEILRDEQKLLFKEIAWLLNMSEGAIVKRYRRTTVAPSGVSMWIPPIPRKRRR